MKGEETDRFEQFVKSHLNDFREEVLSVAHMVKTMGHTGFRKKFFKKNEGKPGDGVICLYDDPGIKLRLFCILFGREILVVGGGGPKTTRTWNEDPVLSRHGNLMIEVSAKVTKRLTEREITYKKNGHGNLTILEGLLDFNNEPD